MGNIVPTTEYAPQPQEGLVPVTPTAEIPPVVQKEVQQETQPVTTSKATLIQQSNDTETAKAETSSQSYGYSRPEGQQPRSDNRNGNFMSSLVFEKSNGIPVTQ